MIDPAFWPSSGVFLDLSAREQITDGLAHCTAVAICDGEGRPTRAFQQGQPAHFFFEFEVLGDIAAPAGGVEFRDANGLVIHGKNSFQYDASLPPIAKVGTRLRYHQVIHLEVAPGEYQFSLGLASADHAAYASYRDGSIGHEQFRHKMVEHCKLNNIGMFAVQFDGAAKLLHHGVANLPGECHLAAVGPNAEKAALLRSLLQVGSLRRVAQSAFDRLAPARDEARAELSPVIVHVTHWKAGSQWIYKILRECAPDRIVEPELNQAQFLNWPVRQGKVYPTVYVTKQEFDRAHLPQDLRCFVVIRDLRDTLISAYFSMKISHPVLDAGLGRLRATLQELSFEEGMIHLMDEWLPPCAQIQRSWLEAGERLLRYEDLIERDLEILESVLLDECQLPVTRRRLQEVVLNSRFERMAGGRKRGQEDVTAHERKGIAGDWRNHFTDGITKAFKNRYGGLLVATGYERDLDW